MSIDNIEDEAKKVYSGLTKHFDIVHIILLVVVAISLTSLGVNYFKPPNTVTKIEYVQPPEEKVVTKIERVPVPGPVQIITIDKPVIVEKLKLPDWFKNDVNQQAISNADLKPTKTGYSVVGTIDTKTGVGDIIAKEKEATFLGWPGNLSASLRYGLVTDGRQEAQLGAKYQPLRIGPIYLGIVGEVNSRPEAKALIELEYKIKSD
jgi:hypothetical protein